MRPLALVLIMACWTAPIAPPCPPPVTRVVAVRCLVQAPPTRPSSTGDESLDAARLLDYAERLDLYVRLIVEPCL